MINMYKKITDFEIGSTFVQERAAVMVDFVIDAIDLSQGIVSAKSVSISGFSFQFTQDDMDRYLERGKPFAETRDEVIAYRKASDAKRKADIVASYANDPDAFIAMVIQRAYSADLDPEYGDDVKANAVKELATIHFPNVELN